jgi:hypothetical protein
MLLEIVFHHQALTAKPLIEIFRAIVAELVDDSLEAQRDEANNIADPDPPLLAGPNGKPMPFTVKDQESFLGVMKVIQDEYNDLTSKRNNLLHGTWFVGYPSIDDPFSAEFLVRKFATSKTGLTAIDLPKNAAQLKALSDRCESVRSWIGWLELCLTGGLKIADTFQQDGKIWHFVTPGGHRSTL